MAAITGAIQRGAGYTIGEKKEPPKQPMSNNRRKMKGIQMIRRQQLRRVQRKRRKKDERLAAAIELTGELPGKGEAFKATKEGNQYEISEVHWEMIYRTDVDREKKEKLTVTPIVLERYPNGKAMRVLQAADGRVEVLNDRFVKAIDSASMNLDYEYEVQGPFFNPKFPKQVYWKSEATTLAVLLYDQDELKEKDILEYLRNIKMEG